MKLTDFHPRYHDTIRQQIAAARPLAGAPAQSAQPHQERPGSHPGVEGPARGLGYRVRLIQCRHRLLDSHDSLPFSVKPLVDAITAFLGFSADNDPALHWEFGQIQTPGPEGVIVSIHPVEQ